MAQTGDANRRSALLAASQVLSGVLEVDDAAKETLAVAEQFLAWLDADMSEPAG